MKIIKVPTRLSYSLLSDFSKHPMLAVNRERKESIHFDIGNAIDTKLFTPSEFNDKFCVFPNFKLAEQLLTLAREVAKIKAQTEEEVLSVMDELNLYQNIKNKEKRIAKFDTQYFWDYLTFLWECDGKIPLNHEDMAMIDAMYHTVINDKYASKFFDNPEQDCEVFYQLEIEWTYLDENFISILDILYVDHKNKTVLPVDFKSTRAPLSRFSGEYRKWKYYYQASVYTDATRYYMNEINTNIKDYDILNFQFLVQTKDLAFMGAPKIFEVSATDIYKSKFGGEIFGNKVTGWDQLVKDIKWHKENDMWEYPREYVLNDGKSPLQIFPEDLNI